MALWLTQGSNPALQGSLHGLWVMLPCLLMCDQETGSFAPGILTAGQEGHLGVQSRENSSEERALAALGNSAACHVDRVAGRTPLGSTKWASVFEHQRQIN
jgi:hypothetical protein